MRPSWALSSNPSHGEVYSMQQLRIKLVSDLRRCFFSGYYGFPHQYNVYWPLQYNWNIVERGVKYHKPYPNSLIFLFAASEFIEIILHILFNQIWVTSFIFHYYYSGGRTYLVGEGVILIVDRQDGGIKRQISISVSAFSAIFGVSLKCVL